jgi:glycosyltransferase involved in cell wall biosynthesis
VHVAIYLADQNPHRDRSLGITQITDCMLRELVKHRDLELTTVASLSSYRFADPRVEARVLPVRTDGKLLRLLVDNTSPLWLPRLADPDVWFHPKGFTSLLGRPRKPVVLTIYDTILQHYADHYPGHRSWLEHGYWLRLLANSLRNADRVLTASEHAREQIVSFCERRGLAPPPITVTYGASDYETWLDEPPIAKQDYVLHLASDAPHKRTDHLLAWWEALASSGRDLPRLKLVGQLSEEGRARAARMTGVEVCDRLERGALEQALGAARCLLLPSEIEGFGLPALESYYLGTPVCYVADTAVDEILRSETEVGRFNLQDRDSLLAALEAALGQTPDQVTAVAAGLRRRFSRRSHGDAVLRALREAAGA